MQGMHIGANVNVNPHSMDPLETVLGPFPCVRMRGLPYDANLEDVLMFFQHLVVLDVVILPSPNANPYANPHVQHPQTGEAFVVFANPMDFQMALQRNRQSMRHGSYIDVFQGKRSDYYAAVSSVRVCVY